MKQKELFYKLQEVEVLKALDLNSEMTDDMLYSIDSIVDVEFMKSIHIDDKNVEKSKIMEKKYYNIKKLIERFNIDKMKNEIDEILSNSLIAFRHEDLDKINICENKALNILSYAIENGEEFDSALNELIKNFNEEDKLILKHVFKYEEDLCDDINRLNDIIKQINGMLLSVIPNKNNFIM